MCKYWNLLTARHRTCFSLSLTRRLFTTSPASVSFLSLLLATSIHWFARFCSEVTNNAPPHNASFISVLGWPKFAYETRRGAYKLHSQRRSRFHFSILPVLYTQDTFMPFLNFKVGHFSCHFLFLSLGVAIKGIQFTLLHCHISFLLFTWFTTCFFIQPWTIAEFT